jgi:hypothetical protein
MRCDVMWCIWHFILASTETSRLLWWLGTLRTMGFVPNHSGRRYSWETGGGVDDGGVRFLQHLLDIEIS